MKLRAWTIEGLNGADIHEDLTVCVKAKSQIDALREGVRVIKKEYKFDCKVEELYAAIDDLDGFEEWKTRDI